MVRPDFAQAGMLVVAIGIIGATVMPHNLYLHTALVQTRKLQQDEPSIRRAIRFNTIDTTMALTIAFFVNAAILVLAAIVFYGKTSVTVAGGQTVTFSPDSDWIRVAYLTLAPLLGTTLASTLFAVALLASGQSSTITGTLAGQVVMEGFMHWRIRPWVRRLITRTLAVVPAILIISVRGNGSVTDLVNLSQVVLCLELPFAMFPLLQFTSFAQAHGPMAERLVPVDYRLGKCHPHHRHGHLQLAGRAAARRGRSSLAAEEWRTAMYNKILVTLDATPTDRAIIDHVKDLAGLMHSRVVLLHVADGWAARAYGPDAVSPEITNDTAYLEKIRAELLASNIPTDAELAYGEPAKEIIKWVEKKGCDLVAMSTHGHRFLADLIFGTTARHVRHNVSVPLLLVRAK